MQVVKKNWPLGWTPNFVTETGDVNGYTQAINLTEDVDNVLRLVKGTKKVSSGAFASGNGEAIFSSTFDLATLIDGTYPGNAKCRYVGLVTAGVASIVRNYDPTNKTVTDFGMSILSGGNSNVAFGSCFGHTLAFSGTQRVHDRGDVQYDLGIAAGANPGAAANSPPFVNADNRNGSSQYDNWDTAAVEGTGYLKAGITYVAVTTAAVENVARAIIQRGIFTTATINLDAMSVGVGTTEDLYSFNVRLGASDALIKIRVEYLLETPTTVSTTPDIKNYYWHEWTNRVNTTIEPDSAAPDLLPAEISSEELNSLLISNPGVTFVPSIREGVNVWSTLQCKRGDFARVGDDDAKDWSVVKGIRVTYYTTIPTEILFNEMKFIGGTQGSLTGEFSYIQQDLRDTGFYLETGVPSSGTAFLTTYGSSNLITPNSPDSQANEVRIYRVSNTTDGYYLIKQYIRVPCKAQIVAGATTAVTGITHGLTTGNVVAFRDGLGNWAGLNGSYSVTVTSSSSFNVACNSGGFGAVSGDISYTNYSPFNDYTTDAEAIAGNIKLNRDIAILPDDIISVIAPYFTRALYLTTKVVVPSMQGDPSVYDTNHLLELSSDTGEVNLFMAKVAEQTIYIGTTKDIYVLQGDGTVDNNGIINFRLVGLGLPVPPVSSAYVVENGTLLYLGLDGWRTVSGSSSGILSNTLHRLFPPISETAGGIEAVRISPRDGSKVSAISVGGRLWAAIEHVTSGRALHKYEFATRKWEFQRNVVAANNPYSLFVEEDGTILFTTESTGDRYLHQLEIGTKIDEITDQVFTFELPYDSFGHPFNRKDAFTFTIRADSGNQNVLITISGQLQNGTTSTVAVTKAFNGISVKTIDISALGPVKKIRVSLSGTCTSFALYEIGFDMDLRPAQVNYLRIPPSDYGIAGRKRIPEIPILIDTLGNTVTFTPVLDLVNQTVSTFATLDKDVYNHSFNSDKAAYVIGGTLQATGDGVFEYYNLITPREIEPLPDPLSYKHIPFTNLGSGSRKRFIQFAFIIDTRGNDVTFTPNVDGTTFAPLVINTTRRKTVVYTFLTEAVGIDIGGTLDSVIDNARFEYYNIDLGECVSEKLPPASRYFRVPCTNFGTAGKKRVRTIPLLLDTRGGTVTFTPSVDGVTYPVSTHVTTSKQTVFHYFEDDVFGVDFCGTLTGPVDFEFYGMLKPEVVEVLPVGKKYDQVGPVELKRMGRIYKAEVRIVTSGTALEYDLIIDSVNVANGTWLTVADKEQVLEINFPKYVMGSIAKLELRSASVFHRLYARLLVRYSGNDSDNSWLVLK